MPRAFLSTDILRRFLRNGPGGRLSQWLVIVILLARALVPVNVMIDMEAAKLGHFTLTLCSGHGPMFTRVALPMPAMSGSHMHQEMRDAALKSTDGKAHPSPAADDSMPTDNGICPFSSALVVAYVALALCIMFYAFRSARRLRKARADHRPTPPSLYARPLTRAPPSFC